MPAELRTPTDSFVSEVTRKPLPPSEDAVLRTTYRRENPDEDNAPIPPVILALPSRIPDEDRMISEGIHKPSTSLIERYAQQARNRQRNKQLIIVGGIALAAKILWDSRKNNF